MSIYYVYSLWTEHTSKTNILTNIKKQNVTSTPEALLNTLFPVLAIYRIFSPANYCLILVFGPNTFLMLSYNLNYKVQMNEDELNWIELEREGKQCSNTGSSTVLKTHYCQGLYHNEERDSAILGLPLQVINSYEEKPPIPSWSSED